METPENTLHAPHTLTWCWGKPRSRFTPSPLSRFLPPSTPTALGLYLHNPPLTHTYTQTPSHPPSSLLFLLAPQLRPCYCCKLWQEWQQLSHSRPIRIYGCIILLNSCPLNFKPQDKGRITDWTADSKVILKSREANNWKSVEPQSQLIMAALEENELLSECNIFYTVCMQGLTI